MKDYSVLYEKIQLPKEAIDVCQEIIPYFDEYPNFEEQTKKYVEGEDIVPALKQIAVDKDLRFDPLFMAFCVYCTDYTHEKYKERNISDKIFYDTMKEIMIWNRDCVKNYNSNGINNLGWLGHQLRPELFRLGRLEFIEEPFPIEEATINGRHFVKGDRIICTHIPEDGPLTPELCHDAFNQAYEFFGVDVVFCESWLLYPKHREFLPKHSNILKFMDEFILFHEVENAGPGDLWRVFGRRDNYKADDVPQETSIQKAYYKWYCEKGVVGAGYGARFKK